jgi:hypothetical protein
MFSNLNSDNLMELIESQATNLYTLYYYSQNSRTKYYMNQYLMNDSIRKLFDYIRKN